MAIDKESTGKINDRANSPWLQVAADGHDVMGATETERLLEIDVDTLPSGSSEPPIHASQVSENESRAKARVAAAGTACCIFGCLLGGPVAAVVSGLGTAFVAQNKEGATGDIARAIGDVALKARDKAREVDEKHRVAEKSVRAASVAVDKAREMDRAYNICEKTKAAVVYTGTTVINFAVEHRVLERSIRGVGRGLEYLGEAVSGEETLQAPTATVSSTNRSDGAEEVVPAPSEVL